MKYIITKVYVVEADDQAQALQILSLAARDGREELFRAEPERVRRKAEHAKGWLAIVWEQLSGRRTKQREDPRSVVL